MAILTRSVTVNAPIETVFDELLDPRRLWTMPDVALSEVVLTPEGVGTTARIWSHFLGFHLEGRLEYVEVSRPERVVMKVGFFMEHPTWTFTCEPDTNGGTRLTGQGEWHVGLPAVGGTLERQMVKEHAPFLESMLAGVKAGLESVAA